VALLRTRLPSASWQDATAVADFFLGIIYPAEGPGNLVSYRNLAVSYLNSTDTGAPSLFQNLTANTGTYDLRVRGMVAMLLTLPRFNEQ
jgi:hypothetical protein